jgi:glycosyltransferase involved in cell wall biosynthesis
MPSERHAESGPPRTARARRVLIEALAARFGGTAQATIHLARELSLRPEIETVIVLARRGSIVERGLSGDACVRCVTLAPSTRLELPRRLGWLAWRLGPLLERERCDVLVSMSGVLPRMPDCPVVCILGNSAMYRSKAPLDALRRWAVRRTARRAAQLVAPSQMMAELVAGSTGKPCAAIPLGVNHSLFFPGAEPGDEILCVADFYRHKRHDLLLDAWLALPAPRPLLRLVGDPDVDRAAHARLLSRIHASGAADGIALDHRVPHERMADVYRRARVFVLPSELESFCMPLAEGMACGVPGVVRGLASLRETGGGGSSYIDGDDPSAWAAVVQRLVNDPALHLRARESAIAAAAPLSWEAFAAEIVRRL